MSVWKRIVDWLGLSPVPDGHCEQCRAPYEWERRTVMFAPPLGIADRVMLVEACRACGGTGRMRACDPEPSVMWRTVNEPWPGAS